MIGGGLDGGFTNFLLGLGVGGFLGIFGIIAASIFIVPTITFIAVALLILMAVASAISILIALYNFESFEVDCFANGFATGLGATLLITILLSFPVAAFLSALAVLFIPLSLFPNLRSNAEYIYN